MSEWSGWSDCTRRVTCTITAHDEVAPDAIRDCDSVGRPDDSLHERIDRNNTDSSSLEGDPKTMRYVDFCLIPHELKSDSSILSTRYALNWLSCDFPWPIHARQYQEQDGSYEVPSSHTEKWEKDILAMHDTTPMSFSIDQSRNLDRVRTSLLLVVYE